MTQKLWEDDQLLPDAVFNRSRRCARSCGPSSGNDSAQMRTVPRVSTLHEKQVRSKEVLWEFRRVEEYVRALMEKGTLKTLRERKVKLVLCAESGLGKLHIMKNGTTCWRGRQWSRGVREECPPPPPKKEGQMQKASAIVGRGLDSPQHSLFQARVSPECLDGVRLVCLHQ